MQRRKTRTEICIGKSTSHTKGALIFNLKRFYRRQICTVTSVLRTKILGSQWKACSKLVHCLVSGAAIHVHVYEECIEPLNCLFAVVDRSIDATRVFNVFSIGVFFGSLI